MARTIQIIKDEITSSFMGNETIQLIYGFPSSSIFEETFSKVSIENILFENIAFCTWTIETLFDTHKSELQSELLNQKSGTLPWYRTMALAFQYGFNLIVDSDQFNNETATDDQIEASKIVKYAAVNEGDQDSRVIIKIAGEASGVLSPINTAQLEAFEAYMQEVRYAGVKITVVNYLPDQLFLALKIYRDPLLIDAQGNSILKGGKPVEEALKNYLKELPFNGELVLAYLVDALQKVEGVRIPHIESASSSWIDPTTGGYGMPNIIAVKTIPESGYYQMPHFNSISYVV